MDQLIAALKAAGVAGPFLVAIVVIWLLLRHGPKLISTISNCFLDHKRFDQEREVSREAVKMAWANREAPKLPLSWNMQPTPPSLIEDKSRRPPSDPLENG